MKKALSVILSLFYLTLSTGAAINMHYCGGELANIKINHHSEGCCCGDREMTNSCCNDKEFNLKLDVDQQVGPLIQIQTNDFVFCIISSFHVDMHQEYVNTEEILTEYIIPPPKSDSIWLLNCTFTFYG